MRLHRLRATAFGPFADTVSVDFDELAAGGLFLLTGATGAGKTSVLDAVCFALYGDVPGDRGAAKRLRSDQAAPDVAPEVSLELTVTGRRFRLVRSPAWDRPKRRGTGTTRQQASVVISERVDDAWTPLSTRLDETGHLVTGLLGMNLTQFTQVAMLPQGRFQEFLRAKSADRHQLLQQLFRTGRFEQVEQWLRDRRQQTRRAHTAHHARIVGVVSRVSEAAGVGLPGWEPDDLVAPLEAGEVAPWVAALDAAAVAEHDEASADAAATTEREAAARADLEHGRRRHERQARFAAARDEAAALAAAAEEHTADLGRLEAADRAVEVGLRHDVALRARADADRARATAGSAREALPDDVTAVTDALRDACRDAETAAARLPDLAERRAALDAALAADDDVRRLTGQVAAAHSARQDAREVLLTARDQLLAVREQRLDGMAAELAGALAVGAECPVCGSAEHPHVATAAPGAPDAAAERAARRAVDDADVLAEAAADRHRSLEQQLAAATARRGEHTREQLATRSAELHADRERTAAAAADLPARQQRLARLQRAVAEAGEADAAATQAAATAAAAGETARAAALEAGFADLPAALAARLDRGALGALRHRVAHHRERAEAVAAVLADVAPDDAGPLPDLDQLAATHRAAAAAATEARTRAAVAQTRRDRLARLGGELGAAVDAWTPVHAELTTLTRLAALADGTSTDNRLRMRLSAYVLAHRLSQVVDAANVRLAPMSDQRYRLEHTGHRGAGETRGGLSLLVRDDWSGETRDPATLSGGETFVVSLALALGLADVITTETAATDLDTLFVDEGFGSLDADTLDDVMDTLDGLREGGRVVGVVSHVAEMRDRIPTQLEVGKSPRGSRVRIVGAGQPG